MAFPFDMLKQVQIASGHLVEDSKLGLDLAAAGHPPMFCPSALVTSQFASSVSGRDTQQQRWEQGHIGLIGSTMPHLLRSAIEKRDFRLLMMGLDFAVPPIFLLATILITMFGVTGLWAVAGLSIVPLYISSSSLLALTACLIVAWWFFGREVLPLRSLAGIPRFVIAKLNLYSRIFGGKRATTWVRTERD
jgi:cellulose synthase/poly-beta-1,6-N-acetylglucosamine synthase-like glycosyltransferase